MIAPASTPRGHRHAASTGHYLATEAAFAILEGGGNAVDAGVAAAIALSVVQPDIVSFGGVAPMILRRADGIIETISGVGHWPRAIPADIFAREHGGKLPPGVLRTVVPAAPDAWITALSRHGTMSLSEVASAARGLAVAGFEVHEYLAYSAEHRFDQYSRWPANAALFQPGGVPLALGQQVKQPALARTLDYMIEEERAAQAGGRVDGLRAARDAFYKGDIARELVSHQQSEGGYLSLDDLARFSCSLGTGISRRWRGHDIVTCEPWCQGPVLLQAMLVLEQAGLDGLEHNSAAYIHAAVESIKLAMADREAFYGDPEIIDVPINALLSPDNIARRAQRIASDRAGIPVPSVISAAPVSNLDSDTSYAATADRWGNVFSVTPSDICAHVPIVPALGFAPSARGSQSRLDPAHPNGFAPGKRPRLTPSPALVLTGQGEVMAIGSPGADIQPQAMMQVLLNILVFGMEPQQAVEAGRFASYAFPGTSYPYHHHGQRLAIEGRIAAPVKAELAGFGHEILDWPDRTKVAGCVELVMRNSATGQVCAAADPRRPSQARVS